MCCPRPDPGVAQRGAALVVAMLVFALVAALMVGLQRDFTLTLQRGTHQLFSEQAWAYLLGGGRIGGSWHCRPTASPMPGPSRPLITLGRCGRSPRHPIRWRREDG